DGRGQKNSDAKCVAELQKEGRAHGKWHADSDTGH
ncbi:CEP250 isoform 14, partial [Pan troglodytes]